VSGEAGDPDVTDDAFLDGRVHILQPRRGYRAGIDAVLLAAAIPAAPGATRVLDCGAGAGTVGLCVAARVPSAQVTLVERSLTLCALAIENITRNGLSERVRVVPGDVTVAARHTAAPALSVERFDHVAVNPPFHDRARGSPARDALKAGSHAMDEGQLELWLRFAARMASAGGTLTLIHKADALKEIFATIADRFGGLRVVPVHPRAGEPAIRVVIQGHKGSRAPLTLCPPLILHGDDGHDFTPQVAMILRGGAAWPLS
jgi:tRNA1(Val) A37 N6-methylase TrmN6